MEALRAQFRRSPAIARLLPFAVFVVLTSLGGWELLGPASIYWMYVLKTLVGAWLIWEARPFIPEMRWALSWEAVAAGVLVFALWVGLDGKYPRLGDIGEGWNPHKQFGEGATLAWLCVGVRIIGSSLVVPPIEEVFYRSLMYRYLVKIDFLQMPLNQMHGLSFIVTSMVFGLMHPDRWVAGILCGLIYQGLVIRKNRLGDAMTAHGITNLLLGLWVVWKGAWNFW